MRRVLSVFLPQWPIERVARRLGPPDRRTVLVVAASRGRQLVMHGCLNALRSGIAPGMDLAHARALIRGTVVVATHEPDRDAKALEALARWATRWSPVVWPDQPDGVVLDITGCGHLFGGDRALASSLQRRLRSAGFTARAAIAGCVGAAWAVARYGRASCALIENGQEQQALTPLPVQALRLDPAAVQGLREVGVERVGQLLALPRASLPARYGGELTRRLDQALGRVCEPVLGVVEAAPIQAALELPGGTTQWEAVASATQFLLAELVRQLERRECGLRRLDATFRRLDSAQLGIVTQTSRPTRSPKHLWSLLRPRLERLHLGYGITEILLRAARVAPIPHHQESFVDEPDHTRGDDAAIAQTIDTLTNRIGPDRVRHFALRACHRPEHAADIVPASNADTPEATLPSRARAPGRPALLFTKPRPIRVIALSPDGPVMSLEAATGERRVIASVGPERIGGEWWRAREPARDYFRVQVESGRWLWVFREVIGGAWFIHGEWA